MDDNGLHALYEEKLNKIAEPTFDEIRAVAVSLVCSHYNEIERTGLKNELDRGVAIIDREELLWQYLYSFGQMHQAKMKLALDKFPGLADVVKDGYSVVDWGCGQGLATVCLMDHLKDKKIEALPEQVILIEPSGLAIENAKLHVKLCGASNLKPLQKTLDNVDGDDIETAAVTTIHLFSNILDIRNIDLMKLASLIAGNAHGKHYFICVSPLMYDGRSARLDLFKSYFNDIESIASEELPDYTYIVTKKNGASEQRSCQVKMNVFMFEAGRSSVIQVKYYPPVQFFAAYQLDSLAESERRNSAEYLTKRNLPPWSAFDVAAPFELGGYVYDDC